MSQACGSGGTALRGIEHAAGAVERDEMHRHAEAFAQFAGKIGGDAARRLLAVAALGQHAVAVIDCGAQHSGRRQILDGVDRRHAHANGPCRSRAYLNFSWRASASISRQVRSST